MKTSTFLLSSALLVASADAFVPRSTFTKSPTTVVRCSMIGGKGWENDSFLDSLGGNPEDREKANQEYQDYKESRAAFVERQARRLQTPEGQRWMKQQQQQPQRGSGDAVDDIMKNSSSEDPFANLGGSSGGSRLKHLMNKSNQNQQPPGMEAPWDAPKLFDLDSSEETNRGEDETAFE